MSSVFGAIDHALNQLYRFCGLIAALLLVSLTCLVLSSIITRLFNIYVGGLTEYAGYTMAACTFFAMAYTFRSGGHIRVLILVNRLSGPIRRADDLWCLGVFAIIVCYFAYYICELAYDSWEFGEISEGGDALPLWIPQLPTAIGSAVFAVCAVHTFIKALFDPHVMKEIDSAGSPEA